MLNKFNLDKCLKETVLEGNFNNFGDIYFYGGERYSGEIENGKPNGQGNLTLKDHSILKGVFDNGVMLRGNYTHFSGVKFRGSFKNYKFSKGLMTFPDGEQLDLSCRLSKGKWVLSKGKLMTSKGKFLNKFEHDKTMIKSRNKIIHQNHKIYGFCIEFEDYSDMRDNHFKPLIIQNFNTFYFRDLKNNIKETVSFLFEKYPYSRITCSDENKIVNDSFDFSFGFKITKESYQWALTFKDLEVLKASGKWILDKKFMRFDGYLYQQDQRLGSFTIEIKKIKGLRIYFKNEEFVDLSSFKNFASKNFNVRIKEIKTRRRAKSDPIFKEMISDIKKTENCLIF